MMIPGMRGMNPRKMQQMMKQLGISMEQLEDVEEVIIRTAGKEIVFHDAEVTVMDARGMRTYQITGTPEEESTGLQISDEDVNLVMEQTGASKEQAKAALESSGGDLAQAIISLSEE